MPRRKLVGYWSWLFAAALVAAIAALGLVGSIAIAGSEENRAPAANIIIAVVAFCVAFAAIRYPIRRLRGTSRPSNYIGGVLTLTAALLNCLLLLAEYATVGQT